MTLAADIALHLPALRAEAEARMVDACTITRPTDEETFNDTTGTYDTSGVETIYSGRCEVQLSDGLNARGTEAGGSDVSITRLTVKIPVSAVGVQVDDLVTITAATWDVDLAGQKFGVIAGHSKTHATARRLEVERITT